MKRIILLCLSVLFICTLLGWGSNPSTHTEEKYTMNTSVSLGAADDTLDKTKITYEVVISGDKDDIDNIDSQKPLINNKYLDLILENGPHNPQIKGGESPYLEITGSFVFDTSGKSKEEIDRMHLFQGIKITDKDNKEHVLKFNWQ